jgi:hypothetical protein
VYTKGTPANIFYSKSSDYGVTWLETQLTNDATYVQTNPSIAIYNTDKIIVTWDGKHSGSTTYTQIRFKVFDGLDWGSIQNHTVSTDGHQSNPVLATDGITVHMIWSGISASTFSQIRYSSFGGTIFSSITEITANASAILYTSPSIAVYNQNIHIVFARSNGDSIWYWKYNGVAWGSNTSWTESNNSEEAPCITMLNENPLVTWIDNDYLGGTIHALLFKEFKNSTWQTTSVIDNTGYSQITNCTIGIIQNNIWILAAFQEANLQVERYIRIGDTWQPKTQLTTDATNKNNINLLENSSTYTNSAYIYYDATTLKFSSDSNNISKLTVADLNIVKKLEYISDTFLSDHVKTTYPMWTKFINAFAQYLDTSFWKNTINITDNLDYNKIYPELLESFVTQYISSFFNANKYGLTDANKRHFISINKIIAGMKGNINSYDFLFKYLKDMDMESEGGSKIVEAFDILLEENENWGSTNYYDGTYVYDGTINYDGGDQYSYKLTVDQNQGVIQDLIDVLHPIGLLVVFELLLDTTENQRITDIFELVIS